MIRNRSYYSKFKLHQWDVEVTCGGLASSLRCLIIQNPSRPTTITSNPCSSAFFLAEELCCTHISKPPTNFSVLFINRAPPSQALCCLDDSSPHILYLTFHGSLLGTSFLNPMIRVNLFLSLSCSFLYLLVHDFFLDVTFRRANGTCQPSVWALPCQWVWRMLSK